MNTGTLVLLLIFWNMSYYFWMTTLMKNVNNFQIAKVQAQDFAYKSVAYKKSVFKTIKTIENNSKIGLKE